MNWIDFSIVFIVVLSSSVSLVRGFIKEALSFFIWFGAFFIAKYFHSALAVYFSNIQDIILRNGMAICALILSSLFVGAVVNKGIGYFVQKKGLSLIDSILATMLGAVHGVFIVAFVLFFVDLFTSISHTNAWNKSEFIPHFSVFIKWFFTYFEQTYT